MKIRTHPNGFTSNERILNGISTKMCYKFIKDESILVKIVNFINIDFKKKNERKRNEQIYGHFFFVITDYFNS